jgi:hypothetical protein
MRNIHDLESYVHDLSPDEQHRFRRIFDVTVDEGDLVIPEDMEGWVEDTFGSVEAVESQDIIRATNRLTDEAALFNGLRSDRPVDATTDVDLDAVVDDHRDGPFSTPETGTPADTFGRVRGDSAVSASNVAKYDARHGLVIADEVNPLSFSEEDLRDRLDVADRWFDEASDAAHRYPFLMWNCLWKSGASIVHGHLQLLVAKDKPYRRIDTYERASRAYADTYDSSLLDDMVGAHADVGLDLGLDVDAFAHLTPRKEKEVMIVGDTVDDAFVSTLHTVLTTLIDELGMRSFNVGLYYPPRADEDWELPVIARVVDRGSLDAKTTDMGGMEVYGGENVVGTDPYEVVRAF